MCRQQSDHPAAYLQYSLPSPPSHQKKANDGEICVPPFERSMTPLEQHEAFWFTPRCDGLQRAYEQLETLYSTHNCLSDVSPKSSQNPGKLSFEPPQHLWSSYASETFVDALVDVAEHLRESGIYPLVLDNRPFHKQGQNLIPRDLYLQDTLVAPLGHPSWLAPSEGSAPKNMEVCSIPLSVFVGNIPKNTSPETLHRLMSLKGIVTELVCDFKPDCWLTALVTYSKHSEAAKAVESLNRHRAIKGASPHRLVCCFAPNPPASISGCDTPLPFVPKFCRLNKKSAIMRRSVHSCFSLLKDGPPGANLFIYGIPSDWTEVTLMRLTQEFGQIVGIRVPPAPISGDQQLNKGFCFVSYDCTESGCAALKALSGRYFLGKPLNIQLKRGERLRPMKDVEISDVEISDVETEAVSSLRSEISEAVASDITSVSMSSTEESFLAHWKDLRSSRFNGKHQTETLPCIRSKTSSNEAVYNHFFFGQKKNKVDHTATTLLHLDEEDEWDEKLKGPTTLDKGDPPSFESLPYCFPLAMSDSWEVTPFSALQFAASCSSRLSSSTKFPPALSFSGGARQNESCPAAGLRNNGFSDGSNLFSDGFLEHADSWNSLVSLL